MADNLYNENLYASLDNDTTSQTDNNEAGNTPDRDYSVEEIISHFTQKDKEKTENLTKQRDIIKTQYADNKKLEEENASLKKQLEEAQARLNNTNNNSADADRIEYLENFVNEYKTERLQQRLTPVLEVFKEYGVDRKDVNDTFNVIKARYGVDLMSNPNVEVARFALGQMYQTNEPNTIPNGNYQVGSSYQEQLAAQQAEAAFQQKKQARLAMLAAKYNKK